MNELEEIRIHMKGRVEIKNLITFWPLTLKKYFLKSQKNYLFEKKSRKFDAEKIAERREDKYVCEEGIKKLE